MRTRANGQRTTDTRRTAFTLVEMLVVVAIIGILVGLILPAVEAVRGKAKIMQARNDISQLAVAVGEWKSNYSAKYLPDMIWLYDPRQLPAKVPYVDPELGRIWPRFTNYLNGIPTPFPGFGDTDPVTGKVSPLDGNQCMVLLLAGYVYENGNTAQPKKYTGTTTLAVSPFADPPLLATGSPPSGKRQGPFIDINPNRIDKFGHYLDPWGTPYVYFTSIYGNDYDLPHPTNSPNSVRPAPFSSDGVNFVVPYKDPPNPSNPNPKFVSQSLFQIICAGPDRKFGPGWTGWTPGNGIYSKSGIGSDDFSNFWDKQLGSP
jgi:prepilin-type N-terminal cleavage/methylation domain-containing protein